MTSATQLNNPAIEAIDAQLSAAGMPTYSEVLALLNESERLGLTFFIGNAYISSAYIDKQTALVDRIKRVNDLCKPVSVQA